MENNNRIERIEKITWSNANTEDLNKLADDRMKETQVEYKDKNLEKSYKSPKVLVALPNEPKNTKVDSKIYNINQGNGHVMDFESYVNAMAKKTEKYYEE